MDTIPQRIGRLKKPKAGEIYIRGVRELVLLLIILTNNKSKKERKIERTVLFPTPTDNTA